MSTLQDWLNNLKEFQLDSMFDTNVLGRAYLYIASSKIDAFSKNTIKGKTGENFKYETELILEDHTVYGSCTCPYEGKCKHIAAMILLANKKQTSDHS